MMLSDASYNYHYSVVPLTCKSTEFQWPSSYHSLDLLSETTWLWNIPTLRAPSGTRPAGRGKGSVLAADNPFWVCKTTLLLHTEIPLLPFNNNGQSTDYICRTQPPAWQLYLLPPRHTSSPSGLMHTRVSTEQPEDHQHGSSKVTALAGILITNLGIYTAPD